VTLAALRCYIRKRFCFPHISQPPFPRPSPQGTPEAPLYPTLLRVSSSGKKHNAAPAAPRWRQRSPLDCLAVQSAHTRGGQVDLAVIGRPTRCAQRRRDDLLRNGPNLFAARTGTALSGWYPQHSLNTLPCRLISFLRKLSSGRDFVQCRSHELASKRHRNHRCDFPGHLSVSSSPCHEIGWVHREICYALHNFRIRLISWQPVV
jgi:hypothetical protein